MNNANYWTRDIAGGYDIYSEYGKLVIDTSEEISYSYVYDHAVFEKPRTLKQLLTEQG